MHYLFWSFEFQSLQSRTFYYVSVHWLKMKFKLLTTAHQTQETFTLVCFVISSHSTWILSDSGFSSVLKLIKLFSTLGLWTFSSSCCKDTSSALCIAGSFSSFWSQVKVTSAETFLTTNHYIQRKFPLLTLALIRPDLHLNRKTHHSSQFQFSFLSSLKDQV